MTVAAIREAMGTALRTIRSSAGTLHASPYLRDSVNAPEAMIDYSVEYDLTFGGPSDAYTFAVMVFAQREASEAAQKFLDTLRDPNNALSVKKVLESDATLAAEVQYARVKSASQPSVVVVGATEYLLVTFDVEVVA